MAEVEGGPLAIHWARCIQELTESLLFFEQKNDTNGKGHHDARKGAKDRNRASPRDNSLDKNRAAVYFFGTLDRPYLSVK